MAAAVKTLSMQKDVDKVLKGAPNDKLLLCRYYGHGREIAFIRNAVELTVADVGTFLPAEDKPRKRRGPGRSGPPVSRREKGKNSPSLSRTSGEAGAAGKKEKECENSPEVNGNSVKKKRVHWWEFFWKKKKKGVQE